jgi:hypothetical protein
MKIVVATPLYPPEIAAPAPYVKELARRLSARHQVTIVTYAQLPEQIPGVRIIAVPKRHVLVARLLQYFFSLWRAVRSADVLYAENGTSVELPAGIVALLSRKPLIVHWGDRAARERAAHSSILRLIERFARARAKEAIADIPLSRPEILPLEPKPEIELKAWETSWAMHLSTLEKLFSHAD